MCRLGLMSLNLRTFNEEEVGVVCLFIILLLNYLLNNHDQNIFIKVCQSWALSCKIVFKELFCHGSSGSHQKTETVFLYLLLPYGTCTMLKCNSITHKTRKLHHCFLFLPLQFIISQKFILMSIPSQEFSLVSSPTAKNKHNNN